MENEIEFLIKFIGKNFVTDTTINDTIFDAKMHATRIMIPKSNINKVGRFFIISKRYINERILPYLEFLFELTDYEGFYLISTDARFCLSPSNYSYHDLSLYNKKFTSNENYHA